MSAEARDCPADQIAVAGRYETSVLPGTMVDDSLNEALRLLRGNVRFVSSTSSLRLSLSAR